MSVLDRFIDKVEITSNCWLWTGGTFQTGYGGFWWGNGMRRAHRVAWQLFIGNIPTGQLVLHTCDVKLCVNPKHLYLGDKRDNTLDCFERGQLTRNVQGQFVGPYNA